MVIHSIFGTIEIMKLGMGLGYSPAKLEIPMDDILAA